MRSQAMLQRIKNEIDNDPTTYSKKSAAEIAILMKRPQSRTPKEYNNVVPDKLDVMREKLLQEKIDAIMTDLVSKGDILAGDIAVKPQEILDRRCDALGFGEVRQGDVEAALKL